MSARACNAAPRYLPRSPAAAHVPKSSDLAGDLKAFGSAFFHNFSRMTWSVRKHVGLTDDVATVMLVPNNRTTAPRLRPVALEFTFAEQQITVRNVDPASVDGLAHTLRLYDRFAP